MTETKTQLRHLRIAPRKIRLVANLIKGMPVNVAEAELSLSSKRAAKPFLKLLRSAIANVKNNHQDLSVDNMFIKTVFVDGGPMLKRHLPRARGSASLIQKKSSHITLILADNPEIKPKFKIIGKIKKDKENKLSKNPPTKDKELFSPTPTPADNAKTKAGEDNRGILKRVFRRKSI